MRGDRRVYHSNSIAGPGSWPWPPTRCDCWPSTPDPDEAARVIAEFLDHPEVGVDVRQSVEWTASVLRDPLSRERAKSTFDTFVDPAEIDRVFELWRDVLPDSIA